MPIYKFQCPECDRVADGLYFTIDKLPKNVTCVCGGDMAQSFDGHKVNAHKYVARHNSMYGKYHHGFGEVVHSYDHKQALLREHGLSESSDSVKGSKSWRDQVPTTAQANTYDKAIELSQEEVNRLMSGGDMSSDQRAKIEHQLKERQIK